MSILEAAAEEITSTLSGTLDARAFAKVLFIARRAEEIACAEGRADEIAVKTKALEALEGKAPITHAAIRANLFSGAPSLKAKQIQLEKAHAAVRTAAAALREQKQDFQQEVRALTSGHASRQLSSGSSLETEIETETVGEIEEDAEYIPLDPETQAKKLAHFSRSFDQLLLTHAEELEAENDAHKKGADLV